MEKRNAVILGASGLVGQRFCQMLSNHPYFNVIGLFGGWASDGKKLSDVLKLPDYCIPQSDLLSETINQLDIEKVKRIDPDIVFSALPNDLAMEAELELASHSIPVFTNASANRMRDDVPLVVPEVNSEFLDIVTEKDGYIVANGNCSSIGLALSLKPLLKYGMRDVNVTTFQAASGAGYPGIPSMDIMDNIIPYIRDEEEKMEKEIPKMFGSLESGRIKNSDVKVNPTCVRVPVRDSHLEVVSVTIHEEVTVEEVSEAFMNFRSHPQEINLPSAPEKPLILRKEENRPQPYLDSMAGYPVRARGMAATVGRLKISGKVIRYVTLSHNTIRGAAGGSVLNAELMFKRGMV
ncbi:aspartate-semialdehyde dehydrogenase [Oxyplasma meridianum]|uniref:Aspartate-semialdehyde dehydrogenase n=1 Tax=Oxyplasma meridianum TaxID=3073602 RepID=A0AAX4NHB6_9ARCH